MLSFGDWDNPGHIILFSHNFVGTQRTFFHYASLQWLMTNENVRIVLNASLSIHCSRCHAGRIVESSTTKLASKLRILTNEFTQ